MLISLSQLNRYYHAITAKMKLKTSLTDVAFAVTNSELLSELDWNIWDNDRDLEKGLLE